MKTSEAGKELIRRFEGYRPIAYKDGGGVLTIGYGHTLGVREGQIIDKEEAESLLRFDLRSAEEEVNKLGTMPQNQFDALVSLVFNIGTTAFHNSTLRKAIIPVFNPEEIRRQWMRWVYDNGRLVEGLHRRRAAELALFMSVPERGISTEMPVIRVDLPTVSGAYDPYLASDIIAHYVLRRLPNSLNASSIKGFQAKEGLKVDGILGPKTWRRICLNIKECTYL